MPRFTSNQKIINSSPELSRGVSDFANSLVARQQLADLKNQRDIKHFENLIDVSAQGILAADQQEITKQIGGIRNDAIGMVSNSKNGQLSLQQVQELKTRRGEIENDVARSQEYMKSYTDIMKMVGKDKEGIFDLEAMNKSFGEWQKKSIRDREDPYSLIRTTNQFDVTEYNKKFINENVTEDGYRIKDGYVTTEKFDPTHQLRTFYRTIKQYRQTINEQYEEVKDETVEYKGKQVKKYENEDDYLLQTYLPQNKIDNTTPHFFKLTGPDDDSKTPTIIKRNETGGWNFPKPLKMQYGQGTAYEFNGKPISFKGEAFKNSEFVGIIPYKLPDDDTEKLYVVMQVPKVTESKGGVDTTGFSETSKQLDETMQILRGSGMVSTKKTDQERVTQVLIPYENIKDDLGNLQFEGIEDVMKELEGNKGATTEESDFVKSAREVDPTLNIRGGQTGTNTPDSKKKVVTKPKTKISPAKKQVKPVTGKYNNTYPLDESIEIDFKNDKIESINKLKSSNNAKIAISKKPKLSASERKSQKATNTPIPENKTKTSKSSESYQNPKYKSRNKRVYKSTVSDKFDWVKRKGKWVLTSAGEEADISKLDRKSYRKAKNEYISLKATDDVMEYYQAKSALDSGGVDKTKYLLNPLYGEYPGNIHATKENHEEKLRDNGYPEAIIKEAIIEKEGDVTYVDNNVLAKYNYKLKKKGFKITEKRWTNKEFYD